MKIASPPPDAPEGYLLLAQCTFCDEPAEDFLILTHREHMACICIKCITKIVDAASERFFVQADSQA